MSLLKTNEIQNYNGSSLTLTASTVSTSAQLNTGGNISVTGSLNVSDDSTTRTNLGLGTISTQDSDSITVTGGSVTGTEIDLKSSGTTIYKSDGTTAVLSESGGVVTLNNGTIGSSVVFPAGHILQTTQNTYNSGDSAVSNSATTAKVSDGASNYYWSHTISGMTAGNDVLVNFSFVGHVKRTSTTAGGAWHIYRDNSIIYGSSQDFMQYIAAVGATSVENYSYINLIFLDTGATSTSHTYYLGYSSNGGSTDVYVRSNTLYTPFIAILQEIKS